MTDRGHVFDDSPFVVAIGGANMDIHGTPSAGLCLSDSNPGTVQISPGGVARNVAENLARLGIDCRLIAPVGKDRHGDMLMCSGRAAGIDMQHVVRLESAPTSTYLSVLDQSGNMHVAISDMSIIEQVGAGLLHGHEPMLNQAALVIIDTNLNHDALDWLSSTLEHQTLFVDTVSTTKAMKIKPFLRSVQTLKPSLAEAEALAGMAMRTEKQLPQLAGWFHDRGVGRVFITLGPDGVFYSTGEAQGFERAGKNESRVSNAGGAGDAFLAGLSYAWLKQWPLRKTLQFSIAAASVTISHKQTSSPAFSLAAVNRLYKDNYAA